MRPFLPILAVQFIGTLGFSIALPFLVFLVVDFGGAPWTYGWVSATYSAFQLVGAPILGRWSDAIGRRRVLALSQAGTLGAWLLFLAALYLPKVAIFQVFGASFTLPLLVLILARAFDGLTGGNISVANAYVADVTSDGGPLRQRAFGWMGMAASAGFAIGPAIGGLLSITPLGYALPVGAAALLSAVATVQCLRLREPLRPCPEGPPTEGAVTRVLGAQQRRCDRPPPAGGTGMHRDPAIVAVLAATFLIYLAFNLFYAIFPVHAQGELGWSANRIGQFFTLMAVVLIVTEGPLLARASAAFRPSGLFAFGVTVLALAMLALASDATPLLFASAILYALGNGLAWPTFQTRVAEAAGQTRQGAVQGAATSTASAASILGLTLGGALYTLYGKPLFFAGATLFLLVALATPLWFRSWGRG